MSEQSGDRITLSERQRERIEEIKEDVQGPDPTDNRVLNGLLDTWDAVGDGLYTDGGRDEDADTVDRCPLDQGHGKTVDDYADMDDWIDWEMVRRLKRFARLLREDPDAARHFARQVAGGDSDGW